MENDVQTMDEAELLSVIRRAENTNVPGSLYQRATTELALRDRDKLLTAKKPGLYLRVGGDIISDGGSIEAGPNSDMDIMVAGSYINKNSSIKQGGVPLLLEPTTPWFKEWWMLYIVYPVIVIIVGAVILKYLSL